MAVIFNVKISFGARRAIGKKKESYEK